MLFGNVSNTRATDGVSDSPPQGRSLTDRVLDGFREFRDQTVDCTAGILSGAGPVNVPAPYQNDKTHALCKAVGAGAGLAGDAFLGATGMVEAGGGTALSATGVGAIVGAPAAAVGVAQVTAAGAGAVMHSSNMSSALNEARTARNGGSRGTPQEKELVREHSSVERARNKALDEVGSLGHDKQPNIGRLGDGKDQLLGFKSADGKRGFRIDFDPDKGIHYNWFDWTKGGKGTGGRWGAETFPGDRDTYLRMLEQLKK